MEQVYEQIRLNVAEKLKWAVSRLHNSKIQVFSELVSGLKF